MWARTRGRPVGPRLRPHAPLREPQRGAPERPLHPVRHRRGRHGSRAGRRADRRAVPQGRVHRHGHRRHPDPRGADPRHGREGRPPGVAVPRAHDDAQRRSSRRVDEARLPGPCGEHLHGVCRGHPRGGQRRPTHRPRALRRGSGRWKRSALRGRRCGRLHEHDGLLLSRHLPTVRRRTRRLRHGRGRRRPVPRGVGDGRSPRSEHPRRGPGRRQHGRRPPHHRPVTRWRGRHYLHAPRPRGGRGRRLAGPPRERPRHLDTTERHGRGGRHGRGVRRQRPQGDLDQGHHRPRPGRGGRHRGSSRGPGHAEGPGPPDGRLRHARPGHAGHRHRLGRSVPLGAGYLHVELVRVRRPQRQRRPRPGLSPCGAAARPLQTKTNISSQRQASSPSTVARPVPFPARADTLPSSTSSSRRSPGTT